jgi:8-oxo-dGTP diphosphatase
MCKRHKEPYLGLYNLPGGKLDDGEPGLKAAYRELEEETGISRRNLTKDLHHLMDFVYYSSKAFPALPGNVRLEVYVGKLVEMVMVFGDEKELVWIDVSRNFFNMKVFAGEGNIGHIYEQIKLRPELL